METIQKLGLVALIQEIEKDLQEQEVEARVIKIDRSDRRIGLSIKAAEYDEEQIKKEQEQLDQLKPGEDLAALEAVLDSTIVSLDSGQTRNEIE